MKLPSRILLGLLPVVALVILYATRLSPNEPIYYPAMGDIATRFRELWLFERFRSDVVPSMKNLALGLLLAWAIGIPVGVALGRARWAREMFGPLLDFGRSVPPIMLIPPLVLVLGIDDSSKIAVIAIAAFFPVCIATIDGMRLADTTLLDAARAIRLGRWRTITSIYLPSGSPAILGGVQVSLQVGFVLTVASEMLAAYRGVGYVTMQAQLAFDSTTMWAGIVLLALLGYLVNAVFVVARNQLLSWHIGMRAHRSTR
jgi:sulfonate transport system permease protein